MEAYKTQVGYEEPPDSYGGATMIGVVVDTHGYKSARIKLQDDTITDLEMNFSIVFFL
jgi:hypothetical protein